ncbi:15241_t:CDS:10 [Cetraspora pellucida]|uniref:15241_t:CDS:1 n=1 Tax=Cetraspora pellucida TaxID=1433469 RepID=A0A9N9G748_9GLOM|nr:15241_t:CDS:10 [Cetraspora pellucida]
MSPQRKFGRKKTPIWQWFSEGEKLNSSHYLARCNFCKQSCPGEPSKMVKHILVTCEEIHQDERNNIENILANASTKKTKNLQKNNSLPQVDNHNDNCNTNTNDVPEVEDISVLSIGEKASINRQLLKALISANAPLSFVEDPEVIKLFQMLNPRYKLPSRKWLSTSVLDKIHENVQCGIQHFISDSMFLTLSGDGWTNVSKNSMLNFIITNEKHESQIFKIDNYSNQRHTGDNIFAIYREIGMSIGLNKWTAFISDSGSDFKKAQRGRVLTIPCMAHQTNLLVKKIVESTYFTPVIKKMLVIINHFRNSNLALSKLRELAGNATLKPQYPCITRWTTFTKSAKTILEIKTNLKVIALIHTSYLISLLKPYDCVIKILETERATLGQVAASWAWLRGVINKSSLTNNDFKDSLIIEIDNRWQKIFNPVFLITWFLHPFHHSKGLNLTWHLYVQEAAYGLFCTFYPDRNQDQFIDEWLNYSNQEGPFSASSVKNPSFTKFPLRYWRTMLNAAPNLSEFACRLLSIPPNSATSERVWSLLGNIHTERRNRLSPVRAAKMAQISCNISDDDNYIDSSDDIDEFMVNLNQISEKLIDDIHVLDVNNEEIIPALKDVFDSKAEFKLDIEKVEFLAEGGYGKVFKGKWKNGHIQYYDNKNKRWKRYGETWVVLKSIKDLKDVKEEFFKEIEAQMISCEEFSYIIRCYGITKCPTTEDYMMIMDYKEDGSLREYLKTNFHRLSWEEKLELLYTAIKGYLPYYDCNHDTSLALQIVNEGRRPTIDYINTPPAIVKLIERCWSKNPGERPKAIELLNELCSYREKDHKIWKEIEKIEENKKFNIPPQEAALQYEISNQTCYISKHYDVPKTGKHDDYGPETDKYDYSETEYMTIPSDSD